MIYCKTCEIPAKVIESGTEPQVICPGCGVKAELIVAMLIAVDKTSEQTLEVLKNIFREYTELGQPDITISEILAMNEEKIKEAQTKFVIRFDNEGLSLDEVLRP